MMANVHRCNSAGGFIIFQLMSPLKKTIFKLLGAISLLFAALPVLAIDKIDDATKTGVIGDGTTLNTAGIQKAIDNCSAGAGCTLRFPAGRYLTGTIRIKSNVTFRLEDGAALLGSTETADYRNLDLFINGSGNPMGPALIVAVDASNVGIEGKGTIDGQSPQLKGKQIFLYIANLGMILPNATAGALSEQNENAGSESALIGTLLYGLAALASSLVNYFNNGTSLAMTTLIGACGIAAFLAFNSLLSAKKGREFTFSEKHTPFG
jgi:hypothetical protein